MLPNEVFALACRAYYDEIGLVVDATNGEFAHSPLTKRECDTGYYLLHEHHQHQGLLQSQDLNKCCFFASDALTWLKKCDYWPENYFELWDIYEKYSSEHSRENAKKTNKKLHQAKDENGKSLHTLKLHEAKDENGKSLIAVKWGKIAGKKIHEAKDENGKSLHGVESAKRLNAKKDENGKSLNASKAAKKANAQVWESTVDGFRANAGNVARHNKANGWDPDARVRTG
jgi:hypothetical protein